VPKPVKTLIAILLLPFCYGAFRAVLRVLQASGQWEGFLVAWLGGISCWLVIYLLLPRPMWMYVFGHELTHVLWGWIFGARVKRFKVTSRGGHVVLTRSNFLVALAPYFFPLYAVLVVGGFAVGHWIWGWHEFQVWFHWLTGVAYGFHITLTWQVLQTEQSDLTSQGVFFSMVVIFLGNVVVLLLGLPLLTQQVGMGTALWWWWRESLEPIRWLIQAL